MSDLNVDDVMIDLGRNLPEWIYHGIGSELTKMVKSLENIEKIQEKKFKDKQKDVNKSQENQIKSADKITKTTQTQLEVLNDTIQSMRDYKKQVSENIKQEEERESIFKSSIKAAKDETRRRKDTLKELETWTGAINKSVSRITHNTRNLKTMSESVAASLKSNNLDNAIDRMGDTFSDIAQQFGMVGNVVGFAILGLSQFTQVTVNHAQKLQTTFSELNQKGLFLEGGLTKFSQMATTASMTLDSLGKVAGKNVSTIALLGGEDGLRSIGRVNKAMRDTESIFRKYGMTIEEINEYQSDSLERERTLGHIQQLSEKDRLNRMSTELQRFANLSTIMGKSVKEIQDAGTSAVEVPETQAMVMQATRGVGREQRAELNREIAMVAEQATAMGATPEMIEVLKRQHIMQAAKVYGNEVTSVRGTRSVAELELLSPELAKTTREMSRRLIEANVSGASPEEIKRIQDQNEQMLLDNEKIYEEMQNNTSLALMIANDIDGGLSYAKDVFLMISNMERRAISGEAFGEAVRKGDEIRERDIDPIAEAAANVNNFINRAQVIWESGLTSVLRIFGAKDNMDKFNDKLGHINDKLDEFIGKFELFDPNESLSNNLDVMFGKDSELASAIEMLVKSLNFLKDNAKEVAMVLGAVAAAGSLGAGAIAYAGIKAMWNGIFGGGGAKGTGAGTGGAAPKGKGFFGGMFNILKFGARRIAPPLAFLLPSNEGIDQGISDETFQNQQKGGKSQYTQEDLMKEVYPDFEKRKEKAINDLKRYKKTGKGNISSIIDTLEELVGTDGINKILQDNGMGGIIHGGQGGNNTHTNNNDDFSGSSADDLLSMGIRNEDSNLATQISEKFLELVFPWYRRLQDNLIKTLFSENKEVINKIFSKSLDNYFFSKDDVKQTILKKRKGIDTDIDKSTRGIMSAMGLSVGGNTDDIMGSVTTDNTIRRGGNAGNFKSVDNLTDNAKMAMDYFMSEGLSREQAAGIVGNLQAESGRNFEKWKTRGDGGKALGIAQWHPDRRKNFERVFGKKLEQSTIQEQLEFIMWEFKNTESKAYSKLKETETAEEAAIAVDKFYERSSGEHRNKRINLAKNLSIGNNHKLSSGNGVLENVLGTVMHHTGGNSFEGAVQTLKNKGLSYNYIIDKDGTIHQMLPDGSVAKHGGKMKGDFKNNNTIGISMVAEDNDNVSSKQVRAAKELQKDLSEKYGFGIDSVWGHGEVSPGRKRPTEGMAAVSAIRNMTDQFTNIGQGRNNPYLKNSRSISDNNIPLNEMSIDDLMPPPPTNLHPTSSNNKDVSKSNKNDNEEILAELRKLNRNIGNSNGYVYA